MRKLGLQKNPSAEANSPEKAVAKPVAPTPSDPKAETENHLRTTVETSNDEPKRTKLKLSASLKEAPTTKPAPVKRKLALSRPPMPAATAVETVSDEAKAPVVQKEPRPATEPVAPPPPSTDSPAIPRELAQKRAAESAKIEEQTSTPAPKETITDEAFDALLGSEPSTEDLPEPKEVDLSKDKAIEAKHKTMLTAPPFDYSEESADRVVISNFPRRGNTPSNRKRTKAPIAEKSDAASESAPIESAPPAVSIDTLRPTVSLKKPPPVDAPLFEGEINPAKNGKMPKILLWLLFIITLSGVGAYYFITTTKSDTPRAGQVSPAAVTQTQVTPPNADTQTAPSPTSAESTQPQRSEEVSALVDNLPISMVRNRGAESILIVGGVAYRIGSLIDPLYELRFIGFTEEGTAIVFEDAQGARYARGY